MERTSDDVGHEAEGVTWPAPEPYARKIPTAGRHAWPTRSIEPELELLGERRELRFAGVHIAGRRRRPSGEKAALPRDLRFGGVMWLGAGLMVALVWVSLAVVPTTASWWTERDLAILEWLVDLRTETGIAVAKVFHWLGTDGVVRMLRIGTLAALVIFRRWRHLFAVIFALLIVEVSMEEVQDAIGRVRPTVEIVGSWDGPSHPSIPVGSFAVTATVMALSLVKKGRRRVVFMWGAVAATLLLGTGRIYLGVDHPTDVLVAALFGPAVAVVLFRWFVPDSEFPVTWNFGSKTHLDVGGSRGAAIKRAVKEQIGVEVLAIEPISLPTSGGSTPVRLRVAGDETAGDRYLFAKLYSQIHLNSDRWYKIARSILYGALEDEVRFSSVRRFVEYEDYIQRVLRAYGVSTAAPISIVELTPEREYLLVSQFLEGAVDITDVDVTEHLIDDALRNVRMMWEAGLAHRDIKPSNVMVHENKVVLIDVAFGMVRPSPWRQAVDLANMMLILALKSDVATVYTRALRLFAPVDIAEAFAATRSITIPRQTRELLTQLKREKGVDLVAEFEDISPFREPIAVQRWSAPRVFRSAVAVLVIAFIVFQVYSEIRGTGVL